MARAVLIVEDEATLAKNIRIFLGREAYEVEACRTGEEALAHLDTFKPDVILLDYNLPTMNGLDVLRELRRRRNAAKVIMITGHGNVDVAVEAMKRGANDYMSKPVALSAIKLAIDNVLAAERLETTLAYYQAKEAKDAGQARIIGTSPPILKLKTMIRRLIEAEDALGEGTPPAVLIVGETGTGKELVARALHFDGARSARPFVEINCATIPDQLLESELFGYEKGAFTDAKERKMGLVEAAEGGTLFLDEIGEIEPSIQAKLLKLLEDKTVRRIGGLREQRADIRIIAATNQDLEKMVRNGKFRSDLFFRLRIVQLVLPALRDRGNDILDLARFFLAVHGTRYGKPNLRLSQQAARQLLDYSWPGNVRELRNLLEQTMLVVPADTVEPEHLAFCDLLSPWEALPEETLPSLLEGKMPTMEEMEKMMLTQALAKTAGNISRAARLLALSRDTLRYRMEKYGIAASS